MDKTPTTVTFRGRRNDSERSVVSWDKKVKTLITALEFPMGINDKKVSKMKGELAELIADAPAAGWAKVLVERAQKLV